MRGMFLSSDAHDFFTRWGDAPGVQDEYGYDVAAYLADSPGIGRHRRNFVSLDSLLRHGYAPDHDSTGTCLGALHEAVDRHNWAAADVLLRYPIQRSHLLTALGNLLSHGESYGYANRRTRKEHEYALLLIQRLNGLTQQECQSMLCQAFNGSVLSFHLPFMLNGAFIPPPSEWDKPRDELWWYSWMMDEDEQGTDANRMRLFYSERLPRLLEQHRHHFPDFEVRDGKLYFTGNPAARLPLLSVRRPRMSMKDLERAALLLAKYQ